MEPDSEECPLEWEDTLEPLEDIQSLVMDSEFLPMEDTEFLAMEDSVDLEDNNSSNNREQEVWEDSVSWDDDDDKLHSWFSFDERIDALRGRKRLGFLEIEFSLTRNDLILFL
jgi:hypothetical protein